MNLFLSSRFGGNLNRTKAREEGGVLRADNLAASAGYTQPGRQCNVGAEKEGHLVVDWGKNRDS
jgi:hypothetical protein